MANPLTLLMPIKEGLSLADVLGVIKQHKGAADKALKKIATVHFARFVLLDRSSPTLLPSPTSTGPFVLGVITEYDGSFEVYVQAFINQIGDVFDALLQATTDGAQLVPVKNNVAAFTKYVAQHDLSQLPGSPNMFSAYPTTVQKILGKS